MKKSDLQNELKQSMLSKNELKTSVLRMLLSSISYLETQKGGAGYEATEEDVMSSIQKEAKQRRDSIEEFLKAGRDDLAEKEEKELKILKEYLPEQMNEEEIRKLIEETISQAGASNIQDIGKVMGILMPKIKGKADGDLVSRIVKNRLASS